MTAFLQFCVNTLGYLRLMTVSDLIDIAILSFVFYKCIGIFQRTNAAKVAKALLIIVVAMWISYQFNLNAINFILSKAVELGLLALVVIFQPEIRRFLERWAATASPAFPAISAVRHRSPIWSRPLPRRWRPTPSCRRARSVP